MGVQTLSEYKLVREGRVLNAARAPGAGRTLVFFHGVTRRWHDFMPLIPDLLTRCEIEALDFPGHGSSDPAESRYRTVDYIDDAVWFLEQLDRPVVLFGHSLGAMVAAAVAAVVPKRVQAIVLEDPPFETMGSRISQTQFLSYMQGIQQLLAAEKSASDYARELADLRFGPPGDERRLRLGDVRDATALSFAANCLTKLDPKVMIPIVGQQWLEGYDLDRVVSQIRCPVLLLQADKAAGGMLVDEDAEFIERTVGNCTRIRFDRVGHLIHWDRTQKTLKLVTELLESLE